MVSASAHGNRQAEEQKRFSQVQRRLKPAIRVSLRRRTQRIYPTSRKLYRCVTTEMYTKIKPHGVLMFKQTHTERAYEGGQTRRREGCSDFAGVHLCYISILQHERTASRPHLQGLERRLGEVLSTTLSSFRCAWRQKKYLRPHEVCARQRYK